MIVAMLTYRSLNTKAETAKADAVAAKKTADETHKIVNSQRTEMRRHIKRLQQEITLLKGQKRRR